jgi:hypothetical protein
MKSNRFYQDHNQKPAGPARVASAGELNQNKIDFPPPHEVAGRAYTSYLNQGSRHGNDVEHWLNAESELLAERNRTRTHNFGNRK